jgi:23S rRNA (uracil1939-C5)-methyltransferase
MPNRKPPRIERLSIIALSKEGYGSATYDRPPHPSSMVEVPFTLPGDEVDAQLFKKRRGVYQSRLEAIVQPSPDREGIRCKHFGKCGGCRWQHIPYRMQLRVKENAVRRAFAKLLTPEVAVHPILACDPPWRYRNKMEFSFSNDAQRNRYLGLMLHQSRGRVMNVEECHLVNPWMVDALQSVRQWWGETDLQAYHPPSNAGSLRTLITREGITTGDRMVMLTVSGNPEFALKQQQIEKFKAFIREAVEPVHPDRHLSIFLRIQQIAKGSRTNFYEMLLHGSDVIREVLQIEDRLGEPPLSLQFRISPSAFFQPNTRQAEKLYSRAFQMAAIPPGGVVYDLYCGAGALGLCAARRARRVVGIEISPEAALDARTNASANKLDNVTILTGSVGAVLTQIAGQEHYPAPDAVLVDPPRMGLDPESLEEIVKLKAPTVVYISCNPSTQAANIEELCGKGYRLRAIQPVDQFPQTIHIENIAILEKNQT